MGWLGANERNKDMISIRNTLRAVALGIAMVAVAAVPTKKAHADGGAVVAGIAGGLILGTVIGSAAQANNGYYNGGYAPSYYAPAPTYYAPAPTYYAPRYYSPPVTFSFGYNSGHRYYGKRNHYRGHRGYRSHKGYRGHRARGHRSRGYDRGYRNARRDFRRARR